MANGTLLDDWLIGKAISGIVRRSDQQSDQAVLERTFVDIGVLAQVTNRNDQIIYGRRGTGKSHLLRVAGAALDRDPRHKSIYVDVRTLGSAQLMTDPTRPLTVRCVTVFRDLLAQVQDDLLDVATNPGRPTPGAGLEEVSALAEVIASRAATVTERHVTAERTASATSGKTAGLTLGLSTAEVSLGLSDEDTTSTRLVEEYRQVLSDTIVFAEVTRSLERAVEAVGLDRITLLLDEWSTIPHDVQPFVAEFLKRTALLSTRVTMKIATLEHRSAFLVERFGTRVGFELGGDLSVGVDLDDYYAYDREPQAVRTTFGELLYRHLSVESPPGHLATAHGVHTAADLEERLFAGDAFVAAVRAGEGVARDFIGIVTKAYFHSVRVRTPAIEATAIHRAAESWFTTDKSPNLSPELALRLRTIVARVVDPAGRRRFLVDPAAADDPVLQALYDFRVLHVVERGWRDRPTGKPYDVYAVDSGACQALAANADLAEALWAGDSGDPEEVPRA